MMVKLKKIYNLQLIIYISRALVKEQNNLKRLISNGAPFWDIILFVKRLERLTRTFIICIDIGIIWNSHRKNGNLGSTYLVSYGFKGAKCVILYRRKKSSNNWRKRPKCNLISFSWLYLRRVASGKWVLHW